MARLRQSTAEPLHLPTKLAYLTLCRSIRMLALLARGQAAKDLQLMVLRTSSASSVARLHVPDWGLATVPCWPRSVECCPGRARPASWSRETQLGWHHRMVRHCGHSCVTATGDHPLDDLQQLIVASRRRIRQSSGAKVGYPVKTGQPRPRHESAGGGRSSR
jgi:hypothetical protein